MVSLAGSAFSRTITLANISGTDAVKSTVGYSKVKPFDEGHTGHTTNDMFAALLDISFTGNETDSFFPQQHYHKVS